MERKCNGCESEKPFTKEFFTTDKRNKSGLASTCRECVNKQKTEWYWRNKEDQDNKSRQRYWDNHERYKALNRVSAKERAGRNQELYRQYLFSHPCKDCGETDIRVLEPDHVGIKTFNISKALRQRHWEIILAELGQCEIVCANDHRRRTYARQGSWREVMQANDPTS